MNLERMMVELEKDRLTVGKTVAESAEPAAEPTAGGLTDAKVNTMLPAELLQGGEIVILLIKPSAWYILLDSLGFFLTVIAIGVAAALLHEYEVISDYVSMRDMLLVAVALMSLRLVWQFLEWLSRVYVLTDRRVIRVRGVLRINVFETSIKRVQHTNTSFSLRERMFGLGTISFSTAGTGGVEASWEMIARPLEIHKIVVQTLNRYR